MIYFYARVSTKEQNLARQLETAKQFKIDEVFEDKESGKNFDREQYQRMKAVMHEGDTLIVKSLDRLGRNKQATKDELQWFRDHGITVRILNIPTTLIEYPEGQEWVMDMLNNIMIEVLSSFDEQERERIRTRQREGIDAMPVVEGKRVSQKTGRALGRPKIDAEKIAQIKKGDLTYEELGVSRQTYWRYKNA